MKRNGFCQRLAAMLAFAGILSSQVAYAAAPGAVTTASQTVPAAIQDVALQDGGVLKGFVVDNIGNAQAGTKVLVAKQNEQVAVVETDATGQFQVQGLNGGVYQIETVRGGGMFRVWAPRTAPPAAYNNAMIVQGDQVLRSQNGQLISFLGNPWVLGVIVATAIAVPLALDKGNGS